MRALIALATVLVATCAVNGFKLPLLKIEAETHYDLGYQIGQARKESLRAFFLEKDGAYQKKLRPYFETAQGQAFVELMFENSKKAFPAFMSELKGMADSSGIPLIDLFIQNCESEIGLLTGQPVESMEHCTDVLSFSARHGKWIAHNEDYSPETIGHVFLLDASIKSSRESFFAFIYPGTLAGWAYGFNQHGLVVTANAVFPRVVGNDTKVPVVFSTRYALTARSPQELVRLLANAPALASSGIGLNVGSTIPDAPLLNVELSSQGNDVQAIDQPDTFMFHFNQYDHHWLKENEMVDLSSRVRNRTAQALVKKNPSLPLSEQGLRSILGDHSDKNYPIYRSGNADSIFTLSTALFDLKGKILRVYTCNPSDENCDWSYHIPLPGPTERKQVDVLESLQ